MTFLPAVFPYLKTWTKKTVSVKYKNDVLSLTLPETEGSKENSINVGIH